MQIHFYHHDIADFIRSLQVPTIAKVSRALDLLERFGSNLGMPHSKSLTAGLFELRIRGTQEVRLLYAFHRNTVVVLCGFLKKSNVLPKRFIQLALRRRMFIDEL